MRRTTGNLMLALANVVIVLMGIGLVALGDLGQMLGGVLFALFGLAGLSMGRPYLTDRLAACTSFSCFACHTPSNFVS